MNAQVAKLKPEAAVEIAPADPLALLRAPFPANQISKLPKETKAQAEQRKAEQAKGNWPAKCTVCEGYHHKNAVHLDYVGHAALTDRLLDVDPHWSWEPVTFGPDGLPLFDRNGGLWIRLTVCGVTRLGYGNAEGKQGGDAVKEIIGDALRNAAMRFGAALDLWHKGDLHAPEPADNDTAPEQPEQTAVDLAIHLLRSFDNSPEHFREAWEKNKKGWQDVMSEPDFARVFAVRQQIAKAFAEAKKKAEEEAARAKSSPPTDLGIGDDEIPF